jgi:hypothetical protein
MRASTTETPLASMSVTASVRSLATGAMRSTRTRSLSAASASRPRRTT